MDAAARPARVEARGWGVRHAGRRAWALRGVDLVIEAGERMLLLGPSGAGKSTLLMALAGLLDPGSGIEQEGELLVDGEDPRRARDRTGLLFQDPETQIVMGLAGDDVAFGLENRCVPTSAIWPRVREAFDAVEFPYDLDRPTHALSGGEQQRLALAGTFALRPGLLMLDEPTANLDPAGAAEVRAVLARLLDRSGATLLLVEHRVDEVLGLVDRVAVLEPGGGVVADGRPDDVFTRRGAALAESGVWVPGHPPARPSGRTDAVPQPLLAARDVGFRYPDATADAVAVAELELRSAETLALTGPNGSGKSTLAMMLAGLLVPTSGRVVASDALSPSHPGEPIARWPARELVRHIGTVFQDPEHQFLTTTARDELLLGPRLAGVDEQTAARRADELLHRLHLDRVAEANPYTLSGGEKRRLSVATALATAPAVLILDEPTFGQDRRTWSELLHLLAALRDEGRGVCIVSHDEPFVDALADRTLRLPPAARPS